ncbi:MAG: NAD(P)H-hydrate epimerase [Candidatus Omnitrophica bacterium]|nr:NAD(P)H-hydrate epimerase [Candidatus Omnitrophota bacterium]
MSEIDKRAQEEYGIPQTVLMENAGRSTAEVIMDDFPSLRREKIACFCGKGNNGGDGFVAGRHLAGKDPERLTVYVMDPGDIKSSAALDNLKMIRKMDLDIRPMEDFLRPSGKETDFTIAVDSIFGTGFKGDLPEECAQASRILKTCKMRIYAIDVPSGLDATTGAASKDCFKASKTITFGLPKQGFYAGRGPDFCGEVVIRDIGFPEELLEEYQ